MCYFKFGYDFTMSQGNDLNMKMSYYFLLGNLFLLQLNDILT